MNGELRISMLIEANAARAKAEVASMRAEVETLGPAGLAAAAGLDEAVDGGAEWASVVQMMRASVQPMVAEANALAAATEQLAIYEESGAVSAREAAQAHDLLARQAMELQARMQAAGVTLDGTTAAAVRQDSALQQLIARSTGLEAATGQSIAEQLRHGQALDDLRAQFDPLFAASRRYELQLAAIDEAERQSAISAQVATAARERAAQAMGSMDDALRQQAAAQAAAEAASAAHAARLDQLQAKYNPLIAASRAYELALEEIAEAERAGVITAQLATAARERAAQAMAPVPAQVAAVGASSQAAAAYVGQLGFQINDIAMMLALGQSPFLLMVQQGPQVVQVFGQMRAAGMAIGPAIAGSFMAMLNPLSLATMAAIGLTAAAVQWATAGEAAAEAAKRLDETVSDLSGRISSYRSALEDVLRPAADLRREWGDQAGAVRELQQALADLERIRALRDLRESTTAARAEFEGLRGEVTQYRQVLENLATAREGFKDGILPRDSISANEAALAVVGQRIQDTFGLLPEEANRVVAALDAMAAAQGPQEVAAAAAVARDVMIEIALQAGDRIPDGFLAATESIITAEQAARTLAGPLADSETYARSLAGVDMASNINAAGFAAGFLASEMGRALATAQMLGGFAPDLNRFGGGLDATYGQTRGETTWYWGQSADSLLPPIAGLRPARPTGGRGGSGGGGGAARDERDALAELIEEQERQIALLRTTDPVQRIILENHEALAKATEAERDEVVGLIGERERLEVLRDGLEDIGAAGEQAFKGLMSGANGFAGAIDIVAEKLSDLVSSWLWDQLWSGGGGGVSAGGGLGTVLAGMIGLGGGGTGTLGLPMPFADGGQVSGPGGPRDDRVPAWLSAGEYVVNAAATAQHLHVLEAINSGRPIPADFGWPPSGGAQAFADGGIVTGSSAPEAWLPAPRGRDAAPAAGMTLIQTFEDHTSGGVTVTTEESTDARGQRQQRMILSDATAEGLSAPGGRAAQTAQALFGLRRTGRRRGG